MRLISRVKALAGALLLAGCLTQQAAAAPFGVVAQPLGGMPPAAGSGRLIRRKPRRFP